MRDDDDGDRCGVQVQHITKERTLPTRLLDISQQSAVRWSRLVWDDASLTPVYVAHFSAAFVWHLLLLWLPTYLRLRFALPVEVGPSCPVIVQSSSSHPPVILQSSSSHRPVIVQSSSNRRRA